MKSICIFFKKLKILGSPHKRNHPPPLSYRNSQSSVRLLPELDKLEDSTYDTPPEDASRGRELRRIGEGDGVRFHGKISWERDEKNLGPEMKKIEANPQGEKSEPTNCACKVTKSNHDTTSKHSSASFASPRSSLTL